MCAHKIRIFLRTVKMKILVACEESQAVTKELRALGHEAYSCDIIECSGGHPEWHIMQDVIPLLNGNCTFRVQDSTEGLKTIWDKWDMIIAFPPCTYLTVTGNRWFNVERYGEKAIKRQKDREEAVEFFMALAEADCEKIAIENPVGIMSSTWRRPDQIINPYQFGDPFEKKTCLWLKGLPELLPTDIVGSYQKKKGQKSEAKHSLALQRLWLNSGQVKMTIEKRGMKQLPVEMVVLNDREEWLRARAGRIGGSDAASILGMNPYRSNIELWKIKTGQMIPEDISDKPYVKYGTEAEKYLRELFKLDYPEYQVFYEENNMWLNDKYPWGHYSADGWLKDQEGRFGIWECKTTNIMQSGQKEKWKNRVPDNYYIQLLHGFLITEAEFAVLKAQLKYEIDGEIYLQTKHYKIERADVEADIEFLESSEKRFWNQVQERIRPGLILPAI